MLWELLLPLQVWTTVEKDALGGNTIHTDKVRKDVHGRGGCGGVSR